MSSELERRIQYFCSRIMVRHIPTTITASYKNEPLTVIVVEDLVPDDRVLMGARTNGDGLELVELRQLRDDPGKAVVPFRLNRVKFLLAPGADDSHVSVSETIIRVDRGASEGKLTIYRGSVQQGSSVLGCSLELIRAGTYIVPSGEPTSDGRFTEAIDLLPLP